MSPRLQKLIDDYAHDYRGMAMTQDELALMLTHFAGQTIGRYQQDVSEVKEI